MYDHYAAAIRLEYGHVPVALYQANRRNALQHLRAKAAANMSRELAALNTNERAGMAPA